MITRLGASLANWIELFLIGGVSLTTGTGQRVSLGQKPAALFAYLALQGQRAVPRSQIASLFWEERSETQAQNSLRQALSDLRKADPILDRVIWADRQVIRLDHTKIKTDTAQLHAALQNGCFDETITTSAGMIRENLLRGTESIGQAFGDWLRDVRIRLHDQALAAVLNSIDDPQADVIKRKAAAEVALAIDALCEPACRAAMQIAAESGDMNRALTLYSRLFDDMVRVLDMEPSQATQDLAVRVKMGGFDKQVTAKQPAVLLHRPVLSLGGQPVIVVLPFQKQGSEDIPEGLTELLAEDIVSEIAGIREMSVISMNSAQKFGAMPIDFEELHKRLHVDYALSAKLRRTGPIYRLSFQLCDARTGLVVWARVLTPSENHLFSAQSRLAEEVVNTLAPSLRSVELMLHSNYKLSDLTAYHLTLRARELIFDLTKSQFDMAGPLLHQAIAKEPQFALAYQYLADWYSLRLGQGWSPDPKSDAAAMMDAARTATKLPGNPGRALAMLAHNMVIYGRAFSEAMHLFDNALSLAPNDAETIMWSGPSMAFADHADVAIDRVSTAIELSPEDPLMFRYEHFLSIANFAHGDYATAEKLGRNAMARNPKYTSNLRVTAAAIIAQGKDDDVATIRQIVLEQEPDFKVSQLVERAPFQSPERRKHFGGLLRDAGFMN